MRSESDEGANIRLSGIAAGKPARVATSLFRPRRVERSLFFAPVLPDRTRSNFFRHDLDPQNLDGADSSGIHFGAADRMRANRRVPPLRSVLSLGHRVRVPAGAPGREILLRDSTDQAVELSQISARPVGISDGAHVRLSIWLTAGARTPNLDPIEALRYESAADALIMPRDPARG